MYYDTALLEIIKADDGRSYAVLYNGTYIGAVRSPEEAHYIATDYAISSAMRQAHEGR
jgi:hypothetical protein